MISVVQTKDKDPAEFTEITIRKEDVNEVIKESVDDLKKFLETEIGNRLTIYSAQGFLGQYIQDLQTKINSLKLYSGTELEKPKK